jgi:DNA-binding MltR family transcriptional regulator
MSAAVVVKAVFSIVNSLLKQGNLLDAFDVRLKLWQESGHIKMFSSKKLQSSLSV